MLDQSIFALTGFGIGGMFLLFVLWMLIWKGFALWFAAREESKWWFIALLVFNTMGLLEIIYIFGFSKWGKNFWAKRKKSDKKS